MMGLMTMRSRGGGGGGGLGGGGGGRLLRAWMAMGWGGKW